MDLLSSVLRQKSIVYKKKLSEIYTRLINLKNSLKNYFKKDVQLFIVADKIFIKQTCI